MDLLSSVDTKTETAEFEVPLYKGENENQNCVLGQSLSILKEEWISLPHPYQFGAETLKTDNVIDFSTYFVLFKSLICKNSGTEELFIGCSSIEALGIQQA